MEHKNKNHLNLVGISRLVSILATFSVAPLAIEGFRNIKESLRANPTSPEAGISVTPAERIVLDSCGDVIKTTRDTWVYEMAERRLMGLPNMSYEDYLTFNEERYNRFIEGLEY
jgi:hypothetical protein